MYLTGYFALGEVSLSVNLSGKYSYDCVCKKFVGWYLKADVSFSDKFDEVISIDRITPLKDGWHDTNITFEESWSDTYSGKYK